MKKNLFLTFCFSFIPGAGQMYQAYMKRGLSIMIIFASFIALIAIVNTPIFSLFAPFSTKTLAHSLTVFPVVYISSNKIIFLFSI